MDHVASHGLTRQLVGGLYAHFALFVKQGLAHAHSFSRLAQHGGNQVLNLRVQFGGNGDSIDQTLCLSLGSS